jgi:hypothetical protein
MKKFNREPLSAADMAHLLDRWDTYDLREVRARRLLFAWWRRGIEREAVEQYEQWRQDAEAHLTNELLGDGR